jgi:hypothetical protein
MRHHDMPVSAFGPGIGLSGVVGPQNGDYTGFRNGLRRNALLGHS